MTIKRIKDGLLELTSENGGVKALVTDKFLDRLSNQTFTELSENYKGMHKGLPEDISERVVMTLPARDYQSVYGDVFMPLYTEDGLPVLPLAHGARGFLVNRPISVPVKSSLTAQCGVGGHAPDLSSFISSAPYQEYGFVTISKLNRRMFGSRPEKTLFYTGEDMYLRKRLRLPYLTNVGTVGHVDHNYNNIVRSNDTVIELGLYSLFVADFKVMTINYARLSLAFRHSVRTGRSYTLDCDKEHAYQELSRPFLKKTFNRNSLFKDRRFLPPGWATGLTDEALKRDADLFADKGKRK